MRFISKIITREGIHTLVLNRRNYSHMVLFQRSRVQQLKVFYLVGCHGGGTKVWEHVVYIGELTSDLKFTPCYGRSAWFGQEWILLKWGSQEIRYSDWMLPLDFYFLFFKGGITYELHNLELENEKREFKCIKTLVNLTRLIYMGC